MTIQEFITTLNRWGREQVPFLFIVDFEMKKPLAFRLADIDPTHLLYDLNGVTNAAPLQKPTGHPQISKFPITLEDFGARFSSVFRHLAYGDSYLANLTVPTALKTDSSLRELFLLSKARYKLWYRDEFLVFSPEIFIKINDGKIISYPMKGTIDASLPSAREKILNDRKELAEHVTIVDLIRNDLSTVANQVQVVRFRYIDELKTSEKNLLQVSSEIAGVLERDYTSRLGEILVRLLPAGSVSGAPKARTVEIIRQAEGQERGYYTGVFGLYDGKSFDSGVMIRFIERKGEQLFYRSGGGITTQSVMEDEYQEAIDKVYVPFN